MPDDVAAKGRSVAPPSKAAVPVCEKVLGRNGVMLSRVNSTVGTITKHEFVVLQEVACHCSQSLCSFIHTHFCVASCSCSITPKHLMTWYWMQLFKAIDENEDGRLDMKEYTDSILKLAPQLAPQKEAMFACLSRSTVCHIYANTM